MIEQDITSYTQGHQYDAEGVISADIQLERIRHYLNGTRDKSILELGLGNGRMVERLEKEFGDVTVLEGSSELILDYKKKHDQTTAKIHETYFEDFYTDKKFDAVHMGFVLEHVKEPRRIIQKYYDYVAHGGCLFMSVPNAESLHRRVGHEAGLLNDVHTLSETDHRVGHLRYYDSASFRTDIDNAIQTHGGGVLMEGLFLKPLTTAQMQQLSLPPEIIKGFCAVGLLYPELSNSLFAIVRKEI